MDPKKFFTTQENAAGFCAIKKILQDRDIMPSYRRQRGISNQGALKKIGEHPVKAKYRNNSEQIAYLVFKGGKKMFHGAGGMMDQYSCYRGGLIYVFSGPSPRSRTEWNGCRYNWMESY
ncbi:hypothetical protein [Leptospira weilii]|uniref:hypothetical protein n=1 Tax=Leptospira weilii TaxID=28184 RepID=UPI00056D11D2|nr:hypothetical protein [Leptospira weilii]